MKTTAKKTKIVGVQDYIDSTTGEVVPMIVSEMEDRDFDFHKVWMKNFLLTMDEIANKKMTVAFWIIENLDKENKFIFTQRELSSATGVCLDTVSKTLALLQKGNFLKKIRYGRYMVNPDIMYKGSHRSRMGIVFDYSRCVTKEEQEKTEDTPDTEKTSS